MSASIPRLQGSLSNAPILFNLQSQSLHLHRWLSQNYHLALVPSVLKKNHQLTQRRKESIEVSQYAYYAYL